MRLIIITLLISSFACAQVGITPRILELNDEDRHKSHSFKILNLSKKDFAINVTVENWQMTQNNKPEVVASTKNSLDQWIIVNPLSFTIKAGSSQTIRIAFFPPATLSAGEYKTMVYFNQVYKVGVKKGIINSKFRLGAAVYLQIGTKESQGELLSVNPKNNGIFIKTRNQGNTHIRYSGQWSLWEAKLYPGKEMEKKPELLTKKLAYLEKGLVSFGELPTTPILPSDTRNIVLDLKSKKGSIIKGSHYILHIDGKLAGREIRESFNVVF